MTRWRGWHNAFQPRTEKPAHAMSMGMKQTGGRILFLHKMERWFQLEAFSLIVGGKSDGKQTVFALYLVRNRIGLIFKPIKELFQLDFSQSLKSFSS